MFTFPFMAKRSWDHVTNEVVGGRLDLLQGAVGRKGTEMADLLGIGANAWSKYKKGETELSYRHALILKDEFGVSLEWIYGGDRAHNLPGFNAKLKEWEARDTSSDPPRRGRPRKISAAE